MSKVFDMGGNYEYYKFFWIKSKLIFRISSLIPTCIINMQSNYDSDPGKKRR